MEEIEKLLDFLGRLASDDEFRAQFEEDPAKLLAGFGVEVPEGTKAIVPPKEALVAALNNLAREMTFPPTGYYPLPTWIGPFPSPWAPWRGTWAGPYPLPTWIGPFPIPLPWSR